MKESKQYVLGLDLGVASLGWAMVQVQRLGDRWKPVELLESGVRIFEAGVEGDVQQGER